MLSMEERELPREITCSLFFLPHCAHDKIVKNVKIDQIVKIIKISPNFSC